MTNAEAIADEPRTFIAIKNEKGFEIYSHDMPEERYIVSGTRERPVCTCPVFNALKNQPGYKCEHIKAVFDSLPEGEKMAEQESVHSHSNGNIPAAMILKRSVSPDGKIDSLSVEFSVPIDQIPDKNLVEWASSLIKTQEDIARGFVKNNNGKNGKENNSPEKPPANPDGAVYAKLLDINGMDTRYGWKLYIAVLVNGRKIKMFGERDKLAKYIVDAGRPDLSRTIEEGVQINLPCRVILKQEENSDYINIEKVLPANNGRYGK